MKHTSSSLRPWALLAALLLAALASLESSATLVDLPAGGAATRALIIGCDGLGGVYLQPRVQEVAPNLSRLMREGVYTFAARAVMPTVSKPNWASMFFSAGPEEHSVSSNDWSISNTELDPLSGKGVLYPSMFTEVKKQFANYTTLLYTDHSVVLNLLPPPMTESVDYFGWYADTAEGAMNATLQLRDLILSSSDVPNLMFLHIDQIDDAGHHFGWGSEEYYQAITAVDDKIGMLLEALDLAGLTPSTAVLVTSDHGGLKRMHGSTDNADVIVPFFMRGPGVRPGVQLDTYVRNMDVAANVFFALGAALPQEWVGRPLYEAYSDLNGIAPFIPRAPKLDLGVQPSSAAPRASRVSRLPRRPRADACRLLPSSPSDAGDFVTLLCDAFVKSRVASCFDLFELIDLDTPTPARPDPKHDAGLSAGLVDWPVSDAGCVEQCVYVKHLLEDLGWFHPARGYFVPGYREDESQRPDLPAVPTDCGQVLQAAERAALLA